MSIHFVFVEEEARLAKEVSVKQDVKNLHDTFAYIDKVVKRIGNHVQRDFRDEEDRKQRELEKGKSKSKKPRNKGRGDRSSLQEDSSMSLHWDDYEGMNEMERAQLLERAINVLTTDTKPPKRQSRWQTFDDEEEESEDADECSSYSS